MRKLGALAAHLGVLCPALAADPQTDEQKAFYALGVASRSLAQLQPLTPQDGRDDLGRLSDRVNRQASEGRSRGLRREDPRDRPGPRRSRARPQEGRAEFLEKAAKEKGAKKTE